MSDNYTKFPRPESDDSAADGAFEGPTDFHSLQTDFASLNAPPVTQQLKERAPVPTDFRTLTRGAPSPIRPYQNRSATDMLLSFLTPLMILVMVASVIFFLLDVRYVYTEVHDWYLRWFAFWFVFGVVALNRLIARDGKEESVLYIAGMALVVILFTFATTTGFDVGSISRNFMNQPHVAIGFNLTVVAFIWWLTNRLTHECCVDENPSAGDIGILTGTARRVRKAIQREAAPSTRRLELPDGMSEIAPVDPLDWKKPERTSPKPTVSAAERLPKRHPGISIFYFSVPVMAIFALGQRIVQHGGEPMILAGHFYVACYTVAALSLLMLSSLAGLREYFRERRIRLPGGLGPFWIGLGLVLIAMVLFGAVALPMPPLPPIAYVDEHVYDPWRRDGSFELQSVVTPAVDVLERNRVMERIGTGVLVMLGLFVAYGVLRGIGLIAANIARRRDRYPELVVRFFDWMDRVLERMVRVPEMPKFQRRRRVKRANSLAARTRNPLADTTRTPRDKIEACYDALCALAYDLGVPRKPGQTPYEFIHSFPRELDSLREEAFELTDLYVLSAYSQVEFDERTLDRLRKFWLSFEKSRQRVVK